MIDRDELSDEIHAITGTYWPDEDLDVLLRLWKPDPIDLNDPETENRVADAIRALAPEGAYVPLSQRYPWRFDDPTAGVQRTDLLAPLLAAAYALETGALVPGPPPGLCGHKSATPIIHGAEAPPMHCELRAGHRGMHEARVYPTEPGVLAPPGHAYWNDPDPDPSWDEEHPHLVIEDDEGKPFLTGCDCAIGRDHYATEEAP